MPAGAKSEGAEVSTSELRCALSVAAQTVARDGPTYLPVFLRLERELAARDAEGNALARALAAAEQARGGRAA
jgi:hypothetical protein